MLIQPSASEINRFHVWLHMLSSSLQRESTAAWHTYHWIPFPNNHQAPSKGEFPPHPDPLSHNRHYLSVPRISSFRTTSKGALVGTQAYLNYTVSHAAKKPKPVLEPVKPPRAIIFPEQNTSKYHGTAVRQHLLVLTLLFAQTNTKKLCVLTRWYARFVQNTAHLHTVKTDKK